MWFYESLAVEDMPLVRFPDGTYHLYWASFNDNPSVYIVTTKEGVA